MAQLHIEKFGAGEPIVLVHGWAMHSGIWRDFAKQLGQSFEVTCVDLPGHGRSDAIEQFDLASITELLAENIDLTSACWLGWSMGGNIVIELAKRFPERVDSLIVVAGNPCFTETSDWPGIRASDLDAFANNLTIDCKTTLLRFLALQTHGVANAKSLLNKLQIVLGECDVPSISTLQGGLEILKSVDQRNDLKALGCPSLVIMGEQDTLVPVAVANKMQVLAPDWQIHILAKTGHLPFLSKPEPVINLICEFINDYPNVL